MAKTLRSKFHRRSGGLSGNRITLGSHTSLPDHFALFDLLGSFFWMSFSSNASPRQSCWSLDHGDLLRHLHDEFTACIAFKRSGRNLSYAAGSLNNTSLQFGYSFAGFLYTTGAVYFETRWWMHILGIWIQFLQCVFWALWLFTACHVLLWQEQSDDSRECRRAIGGVLDGRLVRKSPGLFDTLQRWELYRRFKTGWKDFKQGLWFDSFDWH